MRKIIDYVKSLFTTPETGEVWYNPYEDIVILTTYTSNSVIKLVKQETVINSKIKEYYFPPEVVAKYIDNNDMVYLGVL